MFIKRLDFTLHIQLAHTDANDVNVKYYDYRMHWIISIFYNFYYVFTVLSFYNYATRMCVYDVYMCVYV